MKQKVGIPNVVAKALFDEGAIAIIGPMRAVAFKELPSEEKREELSRIYGVEFDNIVCSLYGLNYYHVDAE